jgi:hypothetical protein
VLAACGGDSTNPSGPTSAGHRYSIDLTVNAATGTGNCTWTETDHGSLVVTVSATTFTGSASQIVNNKAQFKQNPCTNGCASVLLNTPNGPIDIETVTAVGETPFSNQVTVLYNSTVEDGKFQETCGPVVATTGGTSRTVGTSLQFLDNGASQDVQYVDPATGQSAHMVVTPVVQ